MKNNSLKKMKTRLVNFSPVIAILFIWTVVTQAGLADPVFLPSPGRVCLSFFSLLSPSFFSEHFLPSLTRVGGAFLLSVILAFPIGVLSGQIPTIGRLVHPLCGFMRYLPVAAFVPLCILWFGIDDAQKVAVIVFGVVFQLVLLLAYDSASVPRELIEAGRTLGLSHCSIIFRIVMPAAMPAIWDHLRIAAGWAWSYVVLAELVAGNRGLGYFVVQSQRYLETDRVFAGILFVGMLGAITDWLFNLAASRWFRWM